MRLKHAVYMVTRRVTQRRFLLLPSGEVNACIRYCVAIAAAATGVRIHGICVLSNHYHIIVSDPHGCIPDFVRLLNSPLARAINCYRGRWESLFVQSTGPSYVELKDPTAVLDKAAYTAANPVLSGLVSRGDDWPGVRHVQPGSISVNKPGFFFRAMSGESRPREKTKRSKDKRAEAPDWLKYLKKRRDQDPLPEQVSLKVHPLPIEGDTAEIQKLLADEIVERERRVRIEFRKTGRKFLGVTGIRKQSPFASPDRPEPRRGLSPRVATRDKWARIAALQRSKEFEELHEAARMAFFAGDRDVEFPAGTYAMRVRYNVNCAPEP